MSGNEAKEAYEKSAIMGQMDDDILEQILEERHRQRSLAIGGDTDAFDKKNTRNDWVSYIAAFSGRAGVCMRNEKDGTDFRTNMLKVAALAMAAIEAHDQGWC